ncbi:MAG: hypothetical protein INR70_19525 [Parafilimonas terrae]|nr:hypothetical protein [Parafilimonas terrae]
MSKVRRSRPHKNGPRPIPASPQQAAPAAGDALVEAPATKGTDTSADASEPVAFAQHEPADAPQELEPVSSEPVAAAFEETGETVVAFTETVAEPAAHEAAEMAEAALPAMATTSVASPRVNAEAFGSAVVNYFIGEGEAFASHMRALAGARSMAEIVRLQIGEFQRAANATLTCWGLLTVASNRAVTAR